MNSKRLVTKIYCDYIIEEIDATLRKLKVVMSRNRRDFWNKRDMKARVRELTEKKVDINIENILYSLKQLENEVCDLNTGMTPLYDEIMELEKELRQNTELNECLVQEDLIGLKGRLLSLKELAGRTYDILDEKI